MKKLMIHSMLLSMIVGLVVGCSSNKPQQNSQPETTSPAEKQVSITFWFPGADKVNDDHFLQAVKDFEQSHANIKVETTVLPANAQDIETKLNAAKMSGTFPDVFSAYLVYMGTRGSRGEFAELDGYIEKWDEKDDIYESAYEAGVYQGKTYGIGFFPAPEILTYRKDFFSEAGLDPERPPTNWEELAEDAVKLTVKDSKGNVTRAGFDIPAISPALVFLEPFMRQNGSMVIDEDKGVPAFSDAASVEALQYIVDLHDQGVSIPYNYQKKDEIPFVNGNAAMSFLQTSQISSIIKNQPEWGKQLGFAPVLQHKKQVAFNGQRLFTIGSESKQKDAAWEFIQFMMSKEQMWKRYEELNIPVVRKSLEEQFINANPEMNKILLQYVEFGKGKAVVPWTSLANKHVSLAYEEALSKSKTPEQALKDAETNLLKELK